MEVFSTCVFGIAFVLLVGQLVVRIALAAASGEAGGALLVRAAPIESLRPLYAFFVLLPAALVFIGIGLPFAMRVALAAARGKLGRDDWIVLGVLATCAMLAIWDARTRGTGIVPVSVAAGVSAWHSFRVLVRFGHRYGPALLGLAGLSLGGFTYYQIRLLGGVEPSIAIAPTLLLVGVFAAATGLVVLVGPAWLGGLPTRVQIVLVWLATIGWILTPLLRTRLTTTPATADRLELYMTLGVAFVFLAVAWMMHRNLESPATLAT